ncbi:hypothetical protein H4O14_11530 [Bacillus sp. PAMC26568]|nr:hypothetical protein H4O14_11530 [Bacillus sp. PAMC26568]
MRVKNSLINITAGIGSQIIITLLSFISRTVFITYLGVEYLGINGLFTNIIGMLSLAEAGIGSAIIYSLYKPVAENDKTKITILMNYYKKAYTVIAIIIFALGISIVPFLDYIVKDSDVQYIHLIFMIFLLNTIASYLFSHKISFLNVCQKGYLVTGIYTLSSIMTTLFRLGILILSQNFILYLLIEVFITIITALFFSLVVDKKYPYLKMKMTSKLDEETKSTINKNIKALLLHRIGGYSVFGTDNIIIAAFVSVSAVGLFSNYYMLINICRTFIGQFFDNITHSLGNLIAIGSKEKIYNIFKVTELCNFWIYSFFTIFLFNMIEPFIDLWIGSQFIMSKSVLIILMINFFVSGMRRSISLVKTTSGIFYKDRYAPFVEALVNLVSSIILVQFYGIVGVFIGTLISTIVVPFWIAPYLVYKQVFNKPVLHYFINYVYLVFLGLGTCLLTNFLCNLFTNVGIVQLVLRAAICLLIPNLIFICVFYRSKEFKYLYRILKDFLEKFINKYKLYKKMAS